MLSYFANPVRFQALCKVLVPLLGVAALLLIVPAWIMGLFVVPIDYQQGEAFRIIYVHVPAVMLASIAYGFLAAASFVSFVWRHSLADSAAKAAAPVGAAITFLGLVTGALWGKPMWGAYWVWDARLTSTLVMLFLFIGYMAIRSAIRDENASARIGAITAMAGAINLPIIKFSVDWWSSLHQPASLLRAGGSGIDGSMLPPLLMVIAGYICLFGWLVLLKMLTEIDQRRTQKLRQQNSNRTGSTASAQTTDNPDA
ncbi:Cytochrome c-type biogenesis protein CcmC, putative heme lyase for CcmE [hydrothermal vent metagenome]|uniref:Cytochrome c-type biogenesis protein CcmC, putative heme lyase for CcmE n=1 Tax=hydrothermal vent metagenome TaxID=652676 RepID=A0A3B0SAV1_9ZZZZ